MKQLYLNGLEVDLSHDTIIALSLQINDLGSVQDRQSNFTNTFKIPFTAHNKEVMESAEILPSSTRRPYRNLTAQYIQDGSEIIHNGVAVVESADDNYNVTVYSGNKTFFDLIEGRKLADIDFSDLDHVWNITNAIAFVTNTDGLIYPIVDYGNSFLISRSFNIANAFPWIFFHTIIDRMVAEAGYTIEGDILATEIYQNLIVSIPTLKGDELKLLGSAENNAPQIYDTDLLAATIPLKFDTITSDPLDGIVGNGVLEHTTGVFGPYTRYNVLNTGTYSFAATVKYTIFDTVATVFQISLIGAGVTEFFAQSPQVNADGITVSGQTTMYAEGILLEEGDVVVVRAVAGQDFGSAGTITIEETSTFECTKVKSPIIAYRTWFPIAMNLPDLSQKDFFKVLLQLFGIFVQVDELTKIIYLIQFKKILANRSIARDWSSKRDDQRKPQIAYRIGNYSRSNWMRYKDDADVTKYLGDGYFGIDDGTLKEESTQFTLPFAASDMAKRFVGIDVPVDYRTDPAIPATQAQKEYTDESSPRILILDRTDLGADNFNYFDDGGGVPNLDDENLAHFILPDKEFNLGFGDNLIEKNYTELTTTLDRCKKVTCYYHLKVGDLDDGEGLFDFSIPVYDSFFGHYFYVNRISQFREGELTQVEMVRIKDYTEAVTINIHDACEGDGSFIITATEEGGSWACYDSDGVFIPGGVVAFGGDFYFDPAVTGVGIFTVTYTLEGETYTTVVTVFALPIVTLDPPDPVDASDPPFQLTGADPPGGTWSCVEVPAACTPEGIFDPGVAGAGSWTIAYTYVNENGCSTFSVEGITVT